MVRVRLSGVKLKEIITKSNKQEYMYEHAQGLGFRGNIFGGYILHNSGYIHSTGRYYLNGEEIQDDKEYVLGTDRYVYVRSLFPNIERITKRVFNAKSFQEIYLKKNYWNIKK